MPESESSSELVLDDSGQEIDPNGLIFAETTESPAEPTGTADTAPPAAAEAAKDDEGADKSEATTEPAPAPETPDNKDEETTYEIEGESVSLAELKQGWGFIQQAIQVGKEAEEAREAAQATLNALAESPTEAMLGVFTALAGDDRQKGYLQLVDFASRIVANHIEQEGMPEEKREALRWKMEADRLRAELDDRQRVIRAREAEQFEAAETQRLRTEIDQAIRASGQEPAKALVEATAGQLYDALEAGLKMSTGAAVQLATKKQAKDNASARSKYLAGLSRADVAALPKEVLTAIRKLDLEALAAPGAPAVEAKSKTEKKREPAGKMRRVAW